jgi:hypothetical protein
MKTDAEKLEDALVAANALYPNDPAPVLAREVHRLRAVLAKEEADCLKMIDERDAREAIINELCAAGGLCLGFDFEWSSHYGFADAVRDVQAHVAALREDKKRLGDKAAALRVLCLKHGIAVTD